jgi:hypothetical protein
MMSPPYPLAAVPVERSRRFALPGVARYIAIGLLGAAALSGVYLGLVSLAESPQHALNLFWEDRWLVLPILLTFGVQVGLYAFVRAGAHLAGAAAGASTAAGGGMSTVAMAACCAHHVTDVLPIVGVSLAATFLTTWKAPLMGFGLAANLAGIAVMLWLIRKDRRRAALR